LQNSIETRQKITNERFVIFSHVSIIIVTFGYVILLGSCATKKNALIEPMLDTVSTKTLIIQDNQIILGRASRYYDPGHLDYWIAFPEKQLAIKAFKPFFRNSTFYFVFHYNLSDSSTIHLIAGNRFGRDREWRYIDTTISIKDLPVGITLLNVHRIPANRPPDSWKPVLDITWQKELGKVISQDRVMLDYNFASNKVLSIKVKRFRPKYSHFKRLNELIATGVNVRDER
jgi:hypothetical protein